MSCNNILLILIIIIIIIIIIFLLVSNKNETFKNLKTNLKIDELYNTNDKIMDNFEGYISTCYPFINIKKVNNTIKNNYKINKNMNQIITENKNKIINIYKLLLLNDTSFNDTFFISSIYAQFYYYDKINKSYFNTFVQTIVLHLRNILKEMNVENINIIYDDKRYNFIYISPNNYKGDLFTDKKIQTKILDIRELNIISSPIKINTKKIFNDVLMMLIPNIKGRYNNNEIYIKVNNKDINIARDVILKKQNYDVLVNLCESYLVCLCLALTNTTKSDNYIKAETHYLSLLSKLLRYSKQTNPIYNLENHFRLNNPDEALKNLLNDYFNRQINIPPFPKDDFIRIYEDYNYNGKNMEYNISSANNISPVSIIKTTNKINSLLYNSNPEGKNYYYLVFALYLENKKDEQNLNLDLNNIPPNLVYLQ
jgi:hypothetical protein